MSKANLGRLAAALCSGVLLACAFPPIGESTAAWLAFVPLVVLARYTRPFAAFRYGFLAGLVFWLISISWLLMLARTGASWVAIVPAWVLLSAYCALYTGAFLMVVSWLVRGQSGNPVAGTPESEMGNRDTTWRSMARAVSWLFLISMLWVGFEYLRSTMLTGFPWNALGVSQYEKLTVIQVAEWGGVFAVSAIVILLNVSLGLAIVHLAEVHFRRTPRRLLVEIYPGLLLLMLCLGHGMKAEQRFSEEKIDREILIGAIQPNIPQMKKWPEEFEFARIIYDSLRTKTEMAQIGKPGLIVWPETAVPSLLPDNPLTADFIRDLAMKGTPILVGAMEDAGGSIGRVPRYYNSSFLFDGEGRIIQRYRKRHLVPFGEYLPFDKQIQFIGEMAPLGFSCDPGTSSVVFHLSVPAATTNREATFAALICFEDVFGYLARESVRAGARFLINQTNDAWFDGTAGAVQHMSHCVFRCVENRVAAVRSANTGVTCFIGRTGQIDKATRDAVARGETALTEYRINRICVEGADMPLTLYTRYGDLFFALPCGVLSVLFLVSVVVVEKRKKALETRGPMSDT